VRVRVGLGLGLGLGGSLSLIADCRCTIPGDRGPVTGSRYTIEGDVEMLMNCRSWSCVSITSMAFLAKTTLREH